MGASSRVVVPKDLRAYVGKTELRTALGPDRRMANRLLPAALADLHVRLAKAEGQRAAATGKPILYPRFPLPPNRWHGGFYDDVSIPNREWETHWVGKAGKDLKAGLKAGPDVVVHCRGGLGRAGMVAARLLIEFGVEPADALAEVRRVRPGAI